MKKIAKENIFYKRNLPHIHPRDGIFFITFRLADSLPTNVLEKLKEEKDSEIKLLEKKFNKNKKEFDREKYNLEKRYFAKFDKWLDRSSEGPKWLKDVLIATTIANKIHELNSTRYRLIAYCIMSNHVHLLIDIREFNIITGTNISGKTKDYPLSDTLRFIKGSTARLCNIHLGRTGAFWHHESYDHYVRNEDELRGIGQYILNNPVKAGLVDDWRQWKFSYLENNVT